MKSLLGLLALSLATSAVATSAGAASATYSCKIESITPEEIRLSQYSTNFRVLATDCSPKDLAGLTRINMTAPAAARAALETALVDRRFVALTTPRPAAYGGTLIGVDSVDVGLLQPIEYAQFYVSNRSETDLTLRAEVRRVLDRHDVQRVPRRDHSRGKTLDTWSRDLNVVIDDQLTVSFSEDGKSLSYGRIHPEDWSVHAQYVKVSRADMGRVLSAEASQRLSNVLGSRLPYAIKGRRLSSSNEAQIRFSKTASGLIQIQLVEAK